MDSLPQIEDVCDSLTSIQHCQELSTYLKQIRNLYREES